MPFKWISNHVHDWVTTYTRWTQTYLSVCFPCPNNWFGWRCCSTKHSFSLVLEVFAVYGWVARFDPWCGCHWGFIQARGEGKSYGSFLCRQSTFFPWSDSFTWSRLPGVPLGTQYRSVYWRYIFNFFTFVTLNAPSSHDKNGHSGWTTEYYSWRVMQGMLGLVGLIAFITIYFFFPETSQPGARGIDKMKATGRINSSRSLIFINPLRSIWLLRSPIMLSMVRFQIISSQNEWLIIPKEHHINYDNDIHFWWDSSSNLGCADAHESWYKCYSSHWHTQL